MTTSSPGSAFSREKRLRMAVNVLIRYSDDHASEFLTDAIEILESLYPSELTTLLRELEVAATLEDEVDHYLEFMRVRSQILISLGRLNPGELSVAMKSIET